MKYTTLLLLVLVSVASAQIYTWTDENGAIHFGDNPKNPAQARAVNVEPNVVESASGGQKAPDGDSAKRVTMYATSWCGYCNKARQYFRAKGIDYIEYDIEKDERARRMYDALGGKGVPVILVGKKRLNGFSEAGFNRIYR